MIHCVAVFTLFVACCTIAANGQQCIPDPVYNIELNDTILKWDPSENCNTTHYIVNIHSSGLLEYVYQADDASLDVSFIDYCRTVTFTVTAIAEHIMSQGSEYEATIALPADTDIVVYNFTGDQIDRDVLFQWQIDADYVYCVDKYKVLIWREDDASPEEAESNQNGFYLTDVSQCMNFEVQISVEHLTVEHTAARFEYTVPPAPNNPTLEAIRQDAVTINTTWALESYAINKCNVTALHVNGTRFTATIPINDVPQRPTIDVSIPGLRADSMYYFSVAIENEAGLSQPYQLAVQTLPIDPSLKLDLDVVDYY